MKNFNVTLTMCIVILFLITATVYGVTIGMVSNIGCSIKADLQKLIQLDEGKIDFDINKILPIQEEKRDREIDNILKYKRLIDCSA